MRLVQHLQPHETNLVITEQELNDTGQTRRKGAKIEEIIFEEIEKIEEIILQP